MEDKIKNQLKLHIAGATVRHISSFEELEHYESEHPIDQSFINKWITPFKNIHIHKNNIDHFKASYQKIRGEVSVEISKQLLGEFDWRSRIVGAYLAAIENYSELENILGIHLLKSQVPYAANGYCLALAQFNTPQSIEFLKKYLDYYLSKTELRFDQSIAMAALNWLDKQNGTNEMELFIDKWTTFIANKPNYDLNQAIIKFEKQSVYIEEIKKVK